MFELNENCAVHNLTIKERMDLADIMVECFAGKQLTDNDARLRFFAKTEQTFDPLIKDDCLKYDYPRYFMSLPGDLV